MRYTFKSSRSSKLRHPYPDEFYFRIFNFTLQSEKFDPKGDFIRIYLQAQQKISGKQLHQPIEAIVDHQFARQRALLAFSVLKARG